MNDAERLAKYVSDWRTAVQNFTAYVREIPETAGETSTDLAGWNVKDIVAHVAHLEEILAGAPEEDFEIIELPHVKNLTGMYTEIGVRSRNHKTFVELADNIDAAADKRHLELLENPPIDPTAKPPKTPADIDWDTERLLSNRVLDVWMHEQDIRNAMNQPGGFDAPGAEHTVRYLAKALPMVVGKKVAPAPGTSVEINIPQYQLSSTVQISPAGRAELAEVTEPSTKLTFTPAQFVAAAGGRYVPEIEISGDQELGQTVLVNFGVTP